jgi:hypothetical protein
VHVQDAAGKLHAHVVAEVDARGGPQAHGTSLPA